MSFSFVFCSPAFRVGKKIGFLGCGNVRWVLGYGLFACWMGELLRGVFGYCEYRGLWDMSAPYRYRQSVRGRGKEKRGQEGTACLLS